MSSHIAIEEHETALLAAREAGRAETIARMVEIAEACAGNAKMMAAGIEMAADNPDLSVEKILRFCRQHIGRQDALSAALADRDRYPDSLGAALAGAEPKGEA